MIQASFPKPRASAFMAGVYQVEAIEPRLMLSKVPFIIFVGDDELHYSIANGANADITKREYTGAARGPAFTLDSGEQDYEDAERTFSGSAHLEAGPSGSRGGYAIASGSVASSHKIGGNVFSGGTLVGAIDPFVTGAPHRRLKLTLKMTVTRQVGEGGLQYESPVDGTDDVVSEVVYGSTDPGQDAHGPGTTVYKGVTYYRAVFGGVNFGARMMSSATARGTYRIEYLIEDAGPKLSVTPATLDFGVVKYHKKPVQYFDITNAGAADSVLTGNVEGLVAQTPKAIPLQILSGGGAFSLAAGATRRVRVRAYNRGEAFGLHQATLNLDSNDADDPNDAYAVSAEIPKPTITLKEVEYLHDADGGGEHAVVRGRVDGSLRSFGTGTPIAFPGGTITDSLGTVAGDFEINFLLDPLVAAARASDARTFRFPVNGVAEPVYGAEVNVEQPFNVAVADRDVPDQARTVTAVVPSISFTVSSKKYIDLFRKSKIPRGIPIDLALNSIVAKFTAKVRADEWGVSVGVTEKNRPYAFLDRVVTGYQLDGIASTNLSLSGLKAKFTTEGIVNAWQETLLIDLGGGNAVRPVNSEKLSQLSTSGSTEYQVKRWVPPGTTAHQTVDKVRVAPDEVSFSLAIQQPTSAPPKSPADVIYSLFNYKFLDIELGDLAVNAGGDVKVSLYK